MAKFSVNDAENYGGDLSGYFTLKDDGDSAVVRFMYDSIDDIEGYAIHKVTIGDRDVFINCLREYTDELSQCPLCANKNFQLGRFYFALYNETDEEIQIWTRGKQILKPLMTALNDINGPICGTPIRITRHGASGDKKTSYSFDVLKENADNISLEDLIENVGEPVDPIGTLIKDYTFDELTEYTKTGNLPGIDNNNNFYNNNSSNNNTNYVPRGGNTNGGNTADTPIRRTYTPRGGNVPF